MLKLEPLDYLYRVYRFNSVKLAAESIPVAPATISAALHKLEKEWGIPLLLRTYRGIELTESAKKIAIASETLFEEVGNIENLIRKEQEHQYILNEKNENLLLLLPKGWRQTCAEFFMDFFLEKGIALEMPDINKNNEANLELIENNKMAVLLNHFAEPVKDQLEKYPNVRMIKVKTGKPCVILDSNSERLPLDKKEILPEEVCKLPLLRDIDGHDTVFEIFEFLEQFGDLNIVSNISSINILLSMLKYDKGVALGCNNNIKVGIKSRVRYIPIRSNLRFSMMICYHKDLPEGYVATLERMAMTIM